MEESYETFEEELGPPRADPPPQKPVRQISRPEMYAARKIREEKAPAPQQPVEELKTLPKEPTLPRTASLHKSLSIQNLMQMETPWESVTLNRCLFVAITILVITSGFQSLNETLRGQGRGEEEEVGLRVRRSGTLRRRGTPPEPETSLWEVMFWWLPDLDDEEEDEEEDEDNDDRQVRRRHSIKGATARASRGLRNKPLLDKNIMKQKQRKLKDRRAKKPSDEETKGKKERDKKQEVEEAADDKEVNNGDEDKNEVHNEELPKRSRKLKKEKQKTQKE